MSEDRNPGAVRRGVSPVTTVRVTPAKSDSLQMSCRAPTEPPPDSTLVPQQNESNGIQRQSGEQVFAMDTADEQHFRRMPLFRPVGEFGEFALAVSPIRPLSHLSSRTFALRRASWSKTCPYSSRWSPCRAAYVNVRQAFGRSGLVTVLRIFSSGDS